MTILSTGRTGLIGSNVVFDWLRASCESMMKLDVLPDAGNRRGRDSLQGDACKLECEPGWRPAKVLPNEYICRTATSSSPKGHTRAWTQLPWASASNSAGL